MKTAVVELDADRSLLIVGWMLATANGTAGGVRRLSREESGT
jgi:hypothetical protein